MDRIKLGEFLLAFVSKLNGNVCGKIKKYK
jgi:hypothetical protein